jgi:hypothetical protein
MTRLCDPDRQHDVVTAGEATSRGASAGAARGAGGRTMKKRKVGTQMQQNIPLCCSPLSIWISQLVCRQSNLST